MRMTLFRERMRMISEREMLQTRSVVSRMVFSRVLCLRKCKRGWAMVGPKVSLRLAALPRHAMRARSAVLIHSVGPEAAKRRLGHRSASVRVGDNKSGLPHLAPTLGSRSATARLRQPGKWESADGSGSGDGSDGDSQRSVAQKASRGKRRRLHSPRTISCGRSLVAECLRDRIGSGRAASPVSCRKSRRA